MSTQEPNKLTIKEKIITESIDLGDSFIRKNFENHKEAIKNNASNNVNEYFEFLSKRIDLVEEIISKPPYKNKIDKVFESPDFWKTLEESIKIASISEGQTKKETLSALIVDRLFSETESTEALMINICCERIGHLNENHLKILGLIHTIGKTEGDLKYLEKERERFTENSISELLSQRFSPYFEVTVNQLELGHLEFHNCIDMHYEITSYLGPRILPFEIEMKFRDRQIVFFNTNLGDKLSRDWSKNDLQHARLSGVGQLIAEHVISIIS